MTTAIYTLQELSKTVQVALNVIAYHRARGHIPEPLVWGGRRVYDPDQFTAAVSFFRSRKRYQRRKSNDVAGP